MQFFSKLFNHFDHPTYMPYMYLVCALLFGGYMSLWNPPFQVMDEVKHFYKSYGLAQGTFFCTTEKNKPGMYIPKDIMLLGEKLGIQQLAYHPDQKINKSKLHQTYTLTDTTPTFVEHPFCESPIWSYLPQALGILFAKLFTNNVLWIFYIGRLFNVMFASCIIAYSIRRIPIGKWALAFIALLPMFVHQLGSYSLDGMHYALIFFFYALLCELAFQKEPYTKKQLGIFTIFSVFALQAKIGFIILAPLIFLLPLKQFTSRISGYLFYGLFFFFQIGTFLLSRFLFTIGEYGNLGGLDRNAQITFIFTHPWEFLQIVSTSINQQFDFYWKNLFGVLGWRDYYLTNTHYIFICLCLLLLAVGIKEKYTFSKKQRSIIAATALFSTLGLFAILYIIDDPVGSPIISFFQGKYLLPLFPLLFLTISNITFTSKHLFSLLFIFFIGNAFLTNSSLQQRYYIEQHTTLSPLLTPEATTVEHFINGKIISQTFRAEQNNLSGVTYELIGTKKPYAFVPFRILIQDEQCQKIIRMSNVPHEDIHMNSHTTTSFIPPISDSKGKLFCVTFYPLLAEELRDFGIKRSQKDVYPEGALFINNKKQEGDLIIEFISS